MLFINYHRSAIILYACSVPANINLFAILVFNRSVEEFSTYEGIISHSVAVVLKIHLFYFKSGTVTALKYEKSVYAQTVI